MMKKRVVDLSYAELEQFADQAWTAAARDALAQGHSIVGSKDGRLLRYDADGRIEDIGAASGSRTPSAEISTTGTRAHVGDKADSGTRDLDPSVVGKPRAT
jgi:hypothetical protein